MQQYVVVRGDNLSKIARRSGLKSWREVYFHPANAQFRNKRPNPNLIHPGDIVQLPRPHEVKPAPQAKHRKPAPHSKSTTVDADEADLQTSAIEDAKEAMKKDPTLSRSNWLTRVMALLDQITTEQAERLQNAGVVALLMGVAAVRKGGQVYPVRTEVGLSGVKVKTIPPERRHIATQLFARDRVSTFDGGDAVVLFLDDFATVHLRENMEFIIHPSTINRPARRKTMPADLERGTLRDRLHELDG